MLSHRSWGVGWHAADTDATRSGSRDINLHAPHLVVCSLFALSYQDRVPRSKAFMSSSDLERALLPFPPLVVRNLSVLDHAWRDSAHACAVTGYRLWINVSLDSQGVMQHIGTIPSLRVALLLHKCGPKQAKKHWRSCDMQRHGSAANLNLSRRNRTVEFWISHPLMVLFPSSIFSRPHPCTPDQTRRNAWPRSPRRRQLARPRHAHPHHHSQRGTLPSVHLLAWPSARSAAPALGAAGLFSMSCCTLFGLGQRLDCK